MLDREFVPWAQGHLEGLVGDVTFERMTAEGDSALALWLDGPQADVLALCGDLTDRGDPEEGRQLGSVARHAASRVAIDV